MTREEIIEQIGRLQEQLIALDAAEIAEIEPAEDTVAKAKTLTPFDDIFFTILARSNKWNPVHLSARYMQKHYTRERI